MGVVVLLSGEGGGSHRLKQGPSLTRWANGETDIIFTLLRIFLRPLDKRKRRNKFFKNNYFTVFLDPIYSSYLLRIACDKFNRSSNCLTLLPIMFYSIRSNTSIKLNISAACTAGCTAYECRPIHISLPIQTCFGNLDQSSRSQSRQIRETASIIFCENYNFIRLTSNSNWWHRTWTQSRIFKGFFFSEFLHRRGSVCDRF